MSRRHSFRDLMVLFVSCVLAGVCAPAAQASGPLGGHICTINKHCQEKPPHWHNKRVCPKPICGPCNLQHHGYYHTCWRPSSIPADWSHCPVPPPGMLFSGTPAALPPGVVPNLLPENRVSPPPVHVEPVKPLPRVTPPSGTPTPPAKPAPTPAKKPMAYLP